MTRPAIQNHWQFERAALPQQSANSELMFAENCRA